MEHAQEYVKSRQESGAFGDISKQKEKENWPVKGPWQHHAWLDALKEHAAGAKYPQGHEDAQTDGAAKAVAIGALLAGKEGFASAVEQATRSVQDDDKAVAAAMLVARSVEAAVTGAAKTAADAVRIGKEQALKDLPEAGEAAKEAVSALDALIAPKDPKEGDERKLSHGADVASFRGGGGCSVPTVAVLGMAAAAAPASRLGEDLKTYSQDGASEAVARLRATLAPLGASAPRAIIAGGLLGAVHGSSMLPKDWLERTKDLEAVLGQLKKIGL